MPTPLRWLLLLLVVPSLASTAGLIHTLDGKRIEGEIRFNSDGQLAVTTAGGTKPTLIELDAVLSADFKGTGAEPVKPPLPAPAPRWIGRDVGRNARPGSAMLAQGNMLVQASGQDIGGSIDSFHFAYRPLNGDGELVARLASVEPAERALKLGLMMRSNIDPAAAYAMSLALPRSGLSLLTRQRPGGPSLQRGPGLGAAGLPVWLKLRRQGNKFTAYSADDGRNWQVLGQEEIEMPATILAGVAVCSRSAIVQCNATFEKLTLTGGVADSDKPSNDPSSPSAKGILFKSGSFLAGSNPRLPDDATVRINRDRELSFPSSEVAAVFLKGRTPEFAEKVALHTRAGALFENGDFFEGTIREFDHGRVRVSSVLFGMRQFEQRKVHALVLPPAAAPAASMARYEIKLADGSVLRASELKFVKDRLEIALPAGQSARVAHGELLELNAGPARFQSLADLKPAKIETTQATQDHSFLIDASFDGRPLALLDHRADRGLTLAAGTSLTYALSGQYRTLTARLGVPAHLLPTTPVTFILLADGNEVHRTASRTSVDDPVAVTIDLAGVQSLTLRVESDHPSFGASGAFADPMLVR